MGRFTWLVLLTAGCGTVTVTHRYPLPTGTEGRGLLAAAEAGDRMGWPRAETDDGTVRFVDRPLIGDDKDALAARVDETGQLQIAEVVPATTPPPDVPPRTRLLAEAAQQILAADWVPTRARPVSRRSVAAAAGLDVLLPWLGGAYALQGDPLISPAQFGLTLGTRLFGDLSTGLLLAEAARGISPTWFALYAAALLTINHFTALISDAVELERRNHLADSGFAFTP